ncbi:MAG: NAD+ synthase [Anaerolineae bacterium]|nr:NAD+ synthase [Ardenticatenia bacterium]HQZ69946.1 NAD+ synthase [Anaerolineae bacterium]
MGATPQEAGPRFRVALAQLNVKVGDIAGNGAAILAAIERARSAAADLLVLPEMALCGYPAEDLLLRPEFARRNREAMETLAPATAGLVALVGLAHREGDELFNAAAVLCDGHWVDTVHKAYLPNYGVFDEARYFREGRRFPVFEVGGVRVGASICEDIWYAAGPPQLQALAGAELLVNLSASPYAIGKPAYRERMLGTRAGDTGAFLVYCNLVGGQDELVFDGNSLVLDPDGRVIARGASMAEDFIVLDLPIGEVFRDRLLDPRIRRARLLTPDPRLTPSLHLDMTALRSAETAPLAAAVPAPPAEPLAELWAALVLGTRDYVRKNGFRKVLLGLSGGIDSALTAAIAVDALGAEQVVGVAMPARYSSPSSLGDASDLAGLLGIQLLELPIDDVFQATLDALAPLFEGRAADVTEENLQSRIRGMSLMALSNKFQWLVLTTGNKSEYAVGYATIYGDMCGAYAVLKDVGKLRVYDLVRWRNSRSDGPRIPQHSIDRPPSAELRPDQKDADSLPPYEVLDPILEAYVEREMSREEIVALGFDPAMVDRIARLVDRSEFKRRQAAPGPKVTDRAFGRERRMPITKA